MPNRPRSAIRTIVVHSDALVRDLLAAALTAVTGTEMVGAFADGAAAARAVTTLTPDVAVIDLDVSGNGAQLALRLHRAEPDIGVVLLATHRDANLLNALLPAGIPDWIYVVNPAAHGFTALLRAIHVTHARLIDLSGEPASGRAHAAPEPAWPAFTGRQRIVLRLLARGLTNRAIADTLGIKEKTVENQLAAIYAKLPMDADRSLLHPRVRLAMRFARYDASAENV